LIHYYHFLFILIMLPAHRYILFPYTTLFRSIIGFAQSSYAQLSATSAAVTVNINLTDALSITLGASPTVDFDYNLATDYTQAKTDRKSTRLNSSHVKNSYAVFCLKKKNITKL